MYFYQPPIGLGVAHALGVFFAISYVGSLYLSRQARLVFKSSAQRLREGEQRRKQNDERWRDDPDVIRARLVAVGMSTALSCGIVLWLLWNLAQDFTIAFDAASTRLGFSLPLGDVFPVCLVTPILFLGPLYAEYLMGRLPLQRNWSWRRDLLPMITTWQGWRNYLMAPLTEEVVFRACMLAVYHLAGAPIGRMIFMTPLLFGFAHIHHAWDIFNRYGRSVAAAKRAIFATILQLSYTSLFGFHCSYLFLRSGSIIPPLTSHIFCNIMGLPQVSFHLATFRSRRNAIKAAYIIGILGYIYTMNKWTLVEGCLYWRATSNINGLPIY